MNKELKELKDGNSASREEYRQHTENISRIMAGCMNVGLGQYSHTNRALDLALIRYYKEVGLE